MYISITKRLYNKCLQFILFCEIIVRYSKNRTSFRYSSQSGAGNNVINAVAMHCRKNDPHRVEQRTGQEDLLAYWLTAIAEFHSLHTQLSDCLAVHNHSLPSSPETAQWIGQCSVRQVKTLIATMHNELEALLNDANQFERLTKREGYEQLATHVNHVRHLNQQAKTLLCLASLPTG